MTADEAVPTRKNLSAASGATASRFRNPVSRNSGIDISSNADEQQDQLARRRQDRHAEHGDDDGEVILGRAAAEGLLLQREGTQHAERRRRDEQPFGKERQAVLHERVAQQSRPFRHQECDAEDRRRGRSESASRWRVRCAGRLSATCRRLRSTRVASPVSSTTTASTKSASSGARAIRMSGFIVQPAAAGAVRSPCQRGRRPATARRRRAPARTPECRARPIPFLAHPEGSRSAGRSSAVPRKSVSPHAARRSTSGTPR